MTEGKILGEPELRVLNAIREKMQCKQLDTLMPWISFVGNDHWNPIFHSCDPYYLFFLNHRTSG